MCLELMTSLKSNENWTPKVIWSLGMVERAAKGHLQGYWEIMCLGEVYPLGDARFSLPLSRLIPGPLPIGDLSQPLAKSMVFLIKCDHRLITAKAAN